MTPRPRSWRWFWAGVIVGVAVLRFWEKLGDFIDRVDPLPPVVPPSYGAEDER